MNNPKGTIPCPSPLCRKTNAVHYVFWYVKPSGKRVLSYTCNHVSKMKIVGRDQFGLPLEEMRTGTMTLELDYGLYHQTAKEINTMFKDAPEQWSKGWSKKQQGKQQHQLLMMIKREDND